MRVKTVVACRRLCSAALALLWLCSATGVRAEGPGEGSVSRQNLQVGPCAVRQMDVRYRLDSLLGEPIVNGTYRWFGDGSCDLHYSTTIWLELRAGSSSGYIQLDPAVPDAGDWAFNVAGSPNWDATVCGFRGTEPVSCLSRSQAVALWKTGAVVGFEVAVDAEAFVGSSGASGSRNSGGAPGAGDGAGSWSNGSGVDTGASRGRGAPSLSDAEAATRAMHFYNTRGEWAGQYRFVVATDVRLVPQGRGRVQVHVRYRYECAQQRCAGTAQAGIDERVFDFERGAQGWRVLAMGAYLSGRL